MKERNPRRKERETHRTERWNYKRAPNISFARDENGHDFLQRQVLLSKGLIFSLFIALYNKQCFTICIISQVSLPNKPFVAKIVNLQMYVRVTTKKGRKSRPEDG